MTSGHSVHRGAQTDSSGPLPVVPPWARAPGNGRHGQGGHRSHSPRITRFCRRPPQTHGPGLQRSRCPGERWCRAARTLRPRPGQSGRRAPRCRQLHRGLLASPGFRPRTGWQGINRAVTVPLSGSRGCFRDHAVSALAAVAHPAHGTGALLAEVERSRLLSSRFTPACSICKPEPQPGPPHLCRCRWSPFL